MNSVSSPNGIFPPFTTIVPTNNIARVEYKMNFLSTFILPMMIAESEYIQNDETAITNSGNKGEGIEYK